MRRYYNIKLERRQEVDLIGQKIGELCSEFQAQGYILITVCCLIIGATFAISEDGTDKLKKRFFPDLVDNNVILLYNYWRMVIL